jgi:hypothetical protein
MYLLIALVVLMVGSSVVGSFAGKIQGTTLYVGKMIGEPEFAQDMSNGFQDAITPEYQNKLNLIVPGSWIAILVLGSFITWWGGIVALLITMMVLNAIISRFFPQRLSYYVMLLMNDMTNRIADFKKVKDESRADAGQMMLEKLTDFYLSVKDTDQPVPSLRETKAMPVGGNQEQE